MEIGIEEDRLSYEGKGATVPLYKNNTEENRAKNRRVEFLIYAEKE
jgi:flagellar motor protein MotB